MDKVYQINSTPDMYNNDRMEGRRTAGGAVEKRVKLRNNNIMSS
jgi:hypothetical protein